MGCKTKFPVRYHLTSTIYRIQGESVAPYATQVSDMHKEYRLWQKEQYTVLISRAQYRPPYHICWRLNRQQECNRQNSRNIVKLDMLIDCYTSTLDVMSHTPLREIDMNLHPLTPFYHKLSSALCGYVYLLCSIPDSTRCYLEQSNNLKKRLCEHNTRYGMIEGKEKLIISFIHMKEFERRPMAKTCSFTLFFIR